MDHIINKKYHNIAFEYLDYTFGVTLARFAGIGGSGGSGGKRVILKSVLKLTEGFRYIFFAFLWEFIKTQRQKCPRPTNF